jgi:hypothetical protein
MDIEIEILRIVMMKLYPRRHTKMKKIVRRKVQVTIQVCISKEGGKRQNQGIHEICGQ